MADDCEPKDWEAASSDSTFSLIGIKDTSIFLLCCSYTSSTMLHVWSLCFLRVHLTQASSSQDSQYTSKGLLCALQTVVCRLWVIAVSLSRSRDKPERWDAVVKHAVPPSGTTAGSVQVGHWMVALFVSWHTFASCLSKHTLQKLCRQERVFGSASVCRQTGHFSRSSSLARASLSTSGEGEEERIVRVVSAIATWAWSIHRHALFYRNPAHLWITWRNYIHELTCSVNLYIHEYVLSFYFEFLKHCSFIIL